MEPGREEGIGPVELDDAVGHRVLAEVAPALRSAQAGRHNLEALKHSHEIVLKIFERPKMQQIASRKYRKERYIEKVQP